jgi:hypothetical protein
MRRTLLILAALAVAGLAAAVSIVSLGLYNVSARAGHLPGVSWVLHTTFRNAVRLRAPAEDEVPDLSDPALIALGAGHYATACAPCHAGPDDSRTATMRAMLPVPPPIREAVAGWQPSHLHWIVENGVKMTGMPGWPAGRGEAAGGPAASRGVGATAVRTARRRLLRNLPWQHIGPRATARHSAAGLSGRNLG